MNTKKLISIVCCTLVCVACTKNENKQTVVVDGNHYTKIRDNRTNNNGVVDIELWQLNGVTNKFYTPSLDGNSMIPVMK